MSDGTQAAVLGAVGAMLLWLASGDLMLRLVLPSFRVPLLLAGSAAIILALATARSAWNAARRSHTTASDLAEPPIEGHGRHDHDHDHGHSHGAPRIGLLLLAPVILVLAFGVRPLGPTRPEPPRKGSLASVKTLNPRPTTTLAGATGGAVDLEKPVLDTTIGWLTSAPSAQPSAAELHQRVRIVGYVDGVTTNGFTMSRYSIWCCVADAKTLSVDVITGDAVDDGTWVEVTGTYVAPPPGSDLSLVSTRHGIRATEPVVVVGEPADPYEH